MRLTDSRLLITLLVACLLGSSPVFATDVDGPNDCNRAPVDFGDAPESVPAYPAVPGCFPTCLAAGPVGTRNIACAPISTVPGPAGYVRHVHFATDTQYWLGCIPTNQGIDSEQDAKMNATGAGASACATGVTVDCVEAAFGMSFGQDECYGSTDAALASPITFAVCTPSTVAIPVWNCGPSRIVFVNVLVDWNQDGDWNDNFQCVGGCAYEWAVKNLQVAINPGCTTVNTPAFLSGPRGGDGWMRITVSDQPVNDDFPWAGSATMPVELRNGETEDYPVVITPPQPCPGYEDWGDAPEQDLAYPGVPGHFPTCAFFSAPGTQELACAPISTAPGPTGHVRHLAAASDPVKFWLGCGSTATGTIGVDGEIDGKMNATGAPASVCNPAVPIDCVEAAFGMNFGQDECTGDPTGDAGVTSAVSFSKCATTNVKFNAYNCGSPRDVFLNVLVDWNEDGDWNDNFECATGCAYEWAVKNVAIVLPSGCSAQTSPTFLTGPRAGRGWMRITLTPAPVSDDFPWRGSASVTGGQDFFTAGETEDYPVTITSPPDTCHIGYRDFGDAPEGFQAYASAVIGAFPTCIAPGPIGDQDIECGSPLSIPPGPAGYVLNVATAADPTHFWLGCGVDGETDGKTNLGGAAGSLSFCNAAGPAVDCSDGFGALLFGQDECYGDPEAALATPVTSEVCTLLTIPYRATVCEDHDQQVYLNVLADWNQDGDWNDNVVCKEERCATEWAIKNRLVTLRPGCNPYSIGGITTGPYVGAVWMRMSISANPAPDDFPWNGTLSIGQFNGGETEDYLIKLLPENVGVPDGRPTGLWLGPAVPNPAFDRVSVDFGLPRAAEVSLSVYDLAGRRIAVIENGPSTAGAHHSAWNFRDATGRDVPVGQYILKLRVGGEVLTRRVIRIR